MKKSLGARTLIFPHPVFVVCTYDMDDKPNAMTVSWGGICCSQPPCVAISLRKATYTYGIIKRRKEFTVNITPEKYLKEADYFGIASGREADKFAKTGLTPVKSGFVNAPYIEEFPLILECRVIHTIEIGLHTQFIGEILDAKADENILNENGLPAIKKTDPVIYSTGDELYFTVGEPVGKAHSIGEELA